MIMSKKIILISLFCFFTLSNITGCLMYLSDPPLPEALNIVPPSPDIPPEIAAFSGVWEGKWGANQATVIVIEKIDSSKAEVIFSLGWGELIKPSHVYYRVTAMVLPGPVIEWNIEGNPPNDCPCKIILKMEKGLKNITAFHSFDRVKTKHRADLTRRESDQR